MTKTKKTQSPVKGAAKKAATKKTAKKTAPKTAKKTAPKAAKESFAAPDMTEFATLWQQKWTEMLQEKGWPEHAAMPSVGQMPFMMPFMTPMGGMMGHMAGNNAAIDAATIQHMQHHIATLEARIVALEKIVAKPSSKRK